MEDKKTQQPEVLEPEVTEAADAVETTGAAEAAGTGEQKADGRPTDEAELAALEAEIAESRRRPGKYRWTMKADDMRDAVVNISKATGVWKRYRILAYAMIVFALLPAADFVLTRRAFPLIAAFAALGLGIFFHGKVDRDARGAVKRLPYRGIKFAAEPKKHGVHISDGVNQSSLMPYTFFAKVYETEDWLALVSAKNYSLYIRRDEGSASYRALRDRLKSELKEHFIEKKVH